MSGSRQLFGIDFPTTNMLGSDVVAILSVQPASVSPDGTEALLAVRVSLSDGNQIDRHIFLDLTSGSYGNVIETVLSEGNASNLIVKAVDVIWGDGTNPQVLASYVDLTDSIYASVSSSFWKYELVGLVDSQSIISSDLIEDAIGEAGNGSITRIVADTAGQFFAFESLAGNYIGSSDTANYDNNGTKDIYVVGTDGTSLQRISVVPEFGVQPSEDVHLLDYRRVGDEDQILFESSRISGPHSQMTPTSHLTCSSIGAAPPIIEILSYSGRRRRRFRVWPGIIRGGARKLGGRLRDRERGDVSARLGGPRAARSCDL